MLQDERLVAAVLQEHEALLENYTYGQDTLHDLLHIVSVITSACTALEVECPIVVGGLAVETYTAGGYTTMDVDLISESMAELRVIMLGLGFTAEPGFRYFRHPKFGDVVEFPTPPLEGSKDRVTVIDLPGGERYHCIGIEDIVIDRLGEFVHWDKGNLDKESAVQIISLLKAQADNIDWDYLREVATQKDLARALELMVERTRQV